MKFHFSRDWTRPPLAQLRSSTANPEHALQWPACPVFFQGTASTTFCDLPMLALYRGQADVYVDEAAIQAGLSRPTTTPIAPRVTLYTLTLPHWLLMLLLMLPMSGLLLRRARRQWIRRRRERRGLCVGCGYDLRASPGRCPECGAPPPPTDSTNCRAEPSQVR